MMSKNNNKTDNLPFFKLPKILFTDARLAEMSLDAKVLYGLFLDRLSLSKRNGWYDNSNKLYIIYSIEAVRLILKCGKSKVIKLMKELEAYGLIERLKRRKNLTDLIYVNRIDAVPENSEPDKEEQASEPNEVPQKTITIKNVGENSFETKVEFSIGGIPNTYIDTSGQSSGGANLNYGGAIFPPRGVSKSVPNNTNFNNTECNNSVIDRWMDKMDGQSEIQTAKNKIKQQIDYDTLMKNYPYSYQQGIINEIIENIMEMYFMRSGRDISISGCKYPMSYVKYRYSQLNYDSINYIMSCLEQNKSKVKNIKKYMMSVLFNATSTCGSYYSSEANHDMLNLKDDLSELLSRRIRI